MTIEANSLEQLGLCLYGRGWQTAISRDYDIQDRTVRHWVSGRNNVPERIFYDLIRRCGSKFAQNAMEIILSIGNGKPEEITIAVYPSNDDLVKITGEKWSCDVHRQVIEEMRDSLNGIIKVRLVDLSSGFYFRWLGDRENTPAMRALCVGESKVSRLS